MTSVDAPGGAIQVSEEQVREALRGVIDPELGADIVELGMVTAIRLPAPARWRSRWR